MKTIRSMMFLALSGVLAAGVQGGIIFNDNFDSSLPATQLNPAVPGWNSLNGTVDYIKNGGYGISCVGGGGGCIDLDGTTSDAADFTSQASFNLVSGHTYVLSYFLSGNQRGGSDTVVASFGGVSQSTVLGAGDPFALYTLTVKPSSNMSSSIVFSNAGGDNIGAILDGVTVEERLAAVPEPGTVVLLPAALAALMYWKRRNRNQ